MMPMGLCLERVLYDQGQKPKTVKESPGTRSTGDSMVTCTVKGNFWFTATNKSIKGFTKIITLSGANTIAVYTAQA